MSIPKNPGLQAVGGQMPCRRAAGNPRQGCGTPADGQAAGKGWSEEACKLIGRVPYCEDKASQPDTQIKPSLLPNLVFLDFKKVGNFKIIHWTFFALVPLFTWQNWEPKLALTELFPSPSFYLRIWRITGRKMLRKVSQDIYVSSKQSHRQPHKIINLLPVNIIIWIQPQINSKEIQKSEWCWITPSFKSSCLWKPLERRVKKMDGRLPAKPICHEYAP